MADDYTTQGGPGGGPKKPGTCPPENLAASVDSNIKGLADGLGSSNGGPVSSDAAFNKNIQSHEISYTKILEAYEVNIESTLNKKARYKPIVFWFSIIALISIWALILALTVTLGIKAFTSDSLALWLATITETLLAFLTTFIVIPEVITKYLFNTEEEKYMNEIIKNISSPYIMQAADKI